MTQRCAGRRSPRPACLQTADGAVAGSNVSPSEKAALFLSVNRNRREMTIDLVFSRAFKEHMPGIDSADTGNQRTKSRNGDDTKQPRLPGVHQNQVPPLLRKEHLCESHQRRLGRSCASGSGSPAVPLLPTNILPPPSSSAAQPSSGQSLTDRSRLIRASADTVLACEALSRC